MTSSVLTGEKRWASTRRGGMTVLGKVPKPVNLPSQRLENHGLDPNVEIVPKGTLSWGSRSSAGSIAWGSSALSPNADGGTGSPSFRSGRPSSGGSGTRPSTAGSDRAHEPMANAWGPNSRPSSASGALTSNQTSPRPRSAETRPGSSQLSRFAEGSENSVAWGGSGTAEKLGVPSSKNEGFSLTSGDFPTLGSEKCNSEKNTESQDNGSHVRPSSSSGGVAPMKDRTATSFIGDVTVNANVNVGSSNSWKRNNPSFSEDGARPNMEKWQGDPQPYPNAGIPPQHYDAWRGPPVNNPPGGVWYRGPPGPPYGTPLAPGGFPVEPFPYYCPQIPATALANPQPVPPQGAGPRGHHPKNGDMYRPHMPDAYIRPGMPMRPGFYPGPVAYEGYYGPQMGYCNSNERDIPFMGMQAGPSAYNRYPTQNAPDHVHPHRSGGYGSAGKAFVSEKVESSHHHDTQGPYKVLLKQHNGWDGKQEQKWEDTVTADASHHKNGDQPRTSSWGADYRNNENMDIQTAHGEEVPSQSFVNRGASSPVPVKATVAESWDHDERASSAFPERPQTLSSTPKDSNLIQKIEGLNAKARASDGWVDVTAVSNRKEQKNRPQVVYAKANQSASEAGILSVPTERTHAGGILSTASHEVGVSTGDKSLEPMSGTAISRRSTHGMESRAEPRGKGRSNAQEGDGWRKKHSVSDSSNAVSDAQFETSANIQVQDHHTSVETTEKYVSYPEGKDEGESAPTILDPSDCQAQRAKMRELAKQRAKQLQMEEEERTRKQRAKALEKLEELNRRTQAVEGSTQKLENVPTDAIQNKQEGPPLVLSESTIVASKGGAPNSVLASNQHVVVQNETGAARVEKSSILSTELQVDIPKSMHKDHVVAQNLSLPLQQDANNVDAIQGINAPHVNDANVSKQKRMGYKQKQNIPLENNSANEIVSTCDSSLQVNPNDTDESSVHQRRKNNKSGKSKHRVEEVLPMAVIPPQMSKETSIAGASVESCKPKVSQFELDPSTTQSSTVSKDAFQSSGQRISLPNEQAHGRVNNQWKSQHPRRMPRNSQVNRAADKFNSADTVVWAPVRSHNKIEVIDEDSHKTEPEVATPSVKSDHITQNNPKNKRAEMERYVPKPVAKEMAQQVSIHKLVAPVINQTVSDETVGKVNSGSQGTESTPSASSALGKVGFATESNNGDSRQSKQGRAHGSWRQRGVRESASMQGLQDGHSSSPSENVQKSVEHQQPQDSIVSFVKEEQPMYSDEWNASDGWNMPDNPDSVALVTIPVVKDKGVTGRGKRHSSKGHRGMGNNHDLDHKKVYSGDTNKTNTQSSPPEMRQTSLAAASKENRGVGEWSTSHWQPKSQTFSATNHRDQSTSEKFNVEETLNMGHPEARRGRRVDSFKEHPRSSNQGPVSPVELAPASVDVQQKQRSSSGFRKNGNQNNRFDRGQETNGDWISSGQDNRQHNLPANRERQRHNSHYEYQPVGPYNSNKSNNIEGPKDGLHNQGPRFKERGQSHSRRGGGNFHGRQSDTVGVDASYD